MVKSCTHCERTIRSGVLCNKCKSDDDVLIDLTEVKRRYKLTNNDIQKADINMINIYATYNIYNLNSPGIRFYLKEIHELAGKLTCKLADTNKKRKAYLKQIPTIERIQNKITEVKERSARITEMLSLYIQKLDGHKLIKLEEYDNMIKEFALKLNINIIEAVDNIFSTIQERHKRRLELNTLISKGNKDSVMKHPYYQKYINNGGYFDEISRIIMKDCSVERQQKLRVIRINKFINDNFGGRNDKILLKKSDLYDNFINSNLSYNECVKKMGEYIDNIKGRKKRIAKINYHINKNFKKDNINDAKSTNIYTNFVEFGDIDKIDIVIEKLKGHFKRVDREKVINNLPYCVQRIARSSDMYSSYINGDITIDDLIKHIGFSKKKLYVKWKKRIYIGRLDPKYDDFAKEIYNFIIGPYDKIMWEGYDIDEIRIIRNLCHKIGIYTVTNANDMTIALYK